VAGVHQGSVGLAIDEVGVVGGALLKAAGAKQSGFEGGGTGGGGQCYSRGGDRGRGAVLFEVTWSIVECRSGGAFIQTSGRGEGGSYWHMQNCRVSGFPGPSIQIVCG
jgi:hypothetical protein